MALSVGFRITVSLLILLPKLRGSDSYPGGTVSHRTRQPSLDAQRLLPGGHFIMATVRVWPPAVPRMEIAGELTPSTPTRLWLMSALRSPIRDRADTLPLEPPLGGL